MRYRLRLLCFTIILIFALSACGGGSTSNLPVEHDISAFAVDFGGRLESSSVGEATELGENARSVKADIVVSKDGLKYSGIIELQYEKFEKGWKLLHSGWSGQYKVSPMEGANEDQIKNALSGFKVSDGNTIGADMISSIAVTNQDTDLEGLKDHVECTVVLENAVAKFSGDIMIDFEFKNNKWERLRIGRLSETDFQPEYISGFEPPLPNEANAISEALERDEDSPFKEEFAQELVVGEPQYSDWGTSVRYPLSLTFATNLHDVILSATSSCQYNEQSGWRTYDTNWTIERLDLSRMLGSWKGTGSYAVTVWKDAPYAIEFEAVSATDEEILCEGTIDGVSGKFKIVSDISVNDDIFFYPQTEDIVISKDTLEAFFYSWYPDYQRGCLDDSPYIKHEYYIEHIG